ncbi:MAG: pilin [Patescibacteria group bacterium]
MITDFKDFLSTITDFVLRPIVGILLALSIVYFLIGVFKYIQSAGDEGKRKEGVTMMIYGIIGLFVFVSVWGLVSLLTGTFDFQNNTRIQPPEI